MLVTSQGATVLARSLNIGASEGAQESDQWPPTRPACGATLHDRL
jgi:hypothetical protein